VAKGKRSFGNVRKLPSGRFQARYTAPDGGYITAPRTFAAKIHAEAWLSDRLREIDAGAWIPGSSDLMGVWCDRFGSCR